MVLGALVEWTKQREILQHLGCTKPHDENPQQSRIYSQPIHWCRISSSNMAMATMNCITWAALRTAGVNRVETHHAWSFSTFSVTCAASNVVNCVQPEIQDFQEQQVIAATTVAPFRMITSHKGATNADNTTPQASLEKTSQKVTQPEIGALNKPMLFLRQWLLNHWVWIPQQISHSPHQRCCCFS